MYAIIQISIDIIFQIKVDDIEFKLKAIIDIRVVNISGLHMFFIISNALNFYSNQCSKVYKSPKSEFYSPKTSWY